MFELEKEFHTLVKALRNIKFDISILSYNDHLFAYAPANLETNLGFCTPGADGVFEILQGKIAVCKGKLDGWNNCAINLPLPKNSCQTKIILDSVRFWRSKDVDFYHNHCELYVMSYSLTNIYGLK